MKLPKPAIPRPEQFVIMFLLLKCQHQTTLMQRPTGTGKSRDFGLMAYYIKHFLNNKVAVVVPTESLAAY
jgi:Rad3-related DNA helicase